MRLISVNVGRPRTVEHQGRKVRTGIYKQPVTGPVAVRKIQVEGDGQADRRVHGGEDKAVYAYPHEHYEYWSQRLERADLATGFFGENLTVEGLLEDAVCIGDRFRIGGTVLEVTQPRTPCYKLAMRAGVEDFVARFAESRRTGFYMRVIEEGVLRAGDVIEPLGRDGDGVSVREIFELRQLRPEASAEFLARAAAIPALSPSWKAAFEKRLGKL